MNRFRFLLFRAIARLLVFAFGIFVFVGCPGCNDSKSRPEHADFELSIHREPVVVTEPKTDPETGLMTERFDLPIDSVLGLLRAGTAGDWEPPLANPFADPPSTPAGPIHEAFVAMGIPFPSGTSASYDPEKRLLSVTQTPEAMALIRYLVTENRDKPNSAALRFEFYEVPALLALRLEQSAAPHFDDTPEWEALQGLLGKDGIRLLEVATLQSRNGERAKFEDGEVVVYRSGTTAEAKDGENETVDFFEQRLVGTIIETDLVIGSDHFTMDLNFALEYHSAPPEWIPTTGGDKVDASPSATVFHVKRLTTQFIIHDGQTCLLTSWTPTGKPEHADSDSRILVFVSANLQREE